MHTHDYDDIYDDNDCLIPLCSHIRHLTYDFAHTLGRRREEQWVYGRMKLCRLLFNDTILDWSLSIIHGSSGISGGSLPQGRIYHGCFLLGLRSFCAFFFYYHADSAVSAEKPAYQAAATANAACCCTDERGLCGVHKHTFLIKYVTHSK